MPQRPTVILAALAALLVSAVAPAGATLFQWTGNNHWYDAIACGSPVTWDDALAQAATTSYLGVTGKLATFDSPEENDAVYARFGPAIAPELWEDPRGVGPYIGFHRAANTQDWQWHDGTPYWTNWYPGEPNDSASYGGWTVFVNHTVLTAVGPGAWGDMDASETWWYSSSYVLEYEAPGSPVPEPSSLSLLAACVVAGGVLRFRKRRK